MILALTAVLIAAVPALADPRIDSKRAEARQVLEQVHQLDVRLEKAIESYNLANVKLDRIRHDMRVNRRELGVARHNLRRAQQLLGERLRAIYIQGQENSTLEILLGAQSLDDLLNRIDTVNRVSDQEAQILAEVKRFRREVGRRAVLLKRAHAEQVRIVAQRAATKARIEAGLAERQRMLSSIKSEIARLQAAELRRQQELARQAAARLAAQRQVQQEQLANTVVGAAAVTPEGVAVAPPSRYGGVVGIAIQYLGVPYVWAGASPSGFDCSGFVMYVFARLGVSLPHSTYSLWGVGVPVSRDQLEPGDLVFFDGLGHMGIYIGGGQFIHSPHTGDVVKISSLSEGWYGYGFVGARRVL